MPVSLIILVFSLVIAYALTHPGNLTLSLAAGCLFLPFYINRPHLYFFGFMLTRPLFDLMTESRGVGGMNVAGMATLVLAGIALFLLMKKGALRCIRGSRFLTAFNRLYALFLLIGLVSFMRSSDKMTSVADFIRLSTVGVVCNYTAVYFSQRQKMVSVLWLIICSTLIPLAFGAYQFATGTGISELGFNRIYATFVHPAVFSQFLVCVFLITLYLYSIYDRRGWRRNILVGYLILLGGALLVTFSRTSWIALCAGLFIYAFAGTKLSKKVAYLLIVLLAVSLLMPLVGERFADVHTYRTSRLSSWQWRLMQWEDTFDTLWEYPFFGHGMGMYEKRFEVMAHNDYLRIAYEVGLLGLLCYVATLVYVLIYALRGVFTQAGSAERRRFRIAAALVSVILIIGLADNLVRSTVVLLYVFVCIGVLLGEDSRESDEGLTYK